MQIYDSAEVAAKTGRTRIAITRIARTHGIGVKKGRDWVFTDEDVAAILKIDPKGGRPPKAKPPADDPA